MSSSARSISAVSVDSKWCWPSGICAQTENDRPCLWRERGGGGMERWREGGEGGQRLTHRCAQAKPHSSTLNRLSKERHCSPPPTPSRSPIHSASALKLVQPIWVPQDVFKSQRGSSGFRVFLCCWLFVGVRQLRCHQSSVPIRNERRSESF